MRVSQRCENRQRCQNRAPSRRTNALRAGHALPSCHAASPPMPGMCTQHRTVRLREHGLPSPCAVDRQPRTKSSSCRPHAEATIESSSVSPLPTCNERSAEVHSSTERDARDNGRVAVQWPDGTQCACARWKEQCSPDALRSEPNTHSSERMIMRSHRVEPKTTARGARRESLCRTRVMRQTRSSACPGVLLRSSGLVRGQSKPPALHGARSHLMAKVASAT